MSAVGLGAVQIGLIEIAEPASSVRFNVQLASVLDNTVFTMSSQSQNTTKCIN